jgi:hypothetical protein
MTAVSKLMGHFPQWQKLLPGVQKPDVGSGLFFMHCWWNRITLLYGQVWPVWSGVQVVMKNKTKRPEQFDYRLTSSELNPLHQDNCKIVGWNGIELPCREQLEGFEMPWSIGLWTLVYAYHHKMPLVSSNFKEAPYFQRWILIVVVFRKDD